MKKLNKKKIVYLVILVIIVGFLLNMYNAFNGNPISKAIAKGKIQKYIVETYPDRDFKIENVGYNFKFNNYYANIVSEEDGLNFNIEFRNKNDIWDDYKELPILEDYELTRKFENSIEELLYEDIDFLGKSFEKDEKGVQDGFLFVQIEVPQGKYRDKEVEYSVDMDDPFVISISLYPETLDGYEEELIEVTKAIKASVDKRKYNGIIGIIVNIGVDNTQYCIALNKEELYIADDELGNYIEEGYGSYKGAYGNYEIGVDNNTKETLDIKK